VAGSQKGLHAGDTGMAISFGDQPKAWTHMESANCHATFWFGIRD